MWFNAIRVLKMQQKFQTHTESLFNVQHMQWTALTNKERSRYTLIHSHIHTVNISRFETTKILSSLWKFRAREHRSFSHPYVPYPQSIFRSGVSDWNYYVLHNIFKSISNKKLSELHQKQRMKKRQLRYTTYLFWMRKFGGYNENQALLYVSIRWTR